MADALNNGFHTELYCYHPNELDYVSAIRAIHQAFEQLSAVSENCNVEPYDNKPALRSLRACLERAGYWGLKEGEGTKMEHNENTAPKFDRYKAAAEASKLALADMQAFCARYTRSQLLEIGRKIEQDAILLARIGAYISHRSGHGSGDPGHDKTVKEQNRVAGAVARALGYIGADEIRF